MHISQISIQIFVLKQLLINYIIANGIACTY